MDEGSTISTQMGPISSNPPKRAEEIERKRERFQYIFDLIFSGLFVLKIYIPCNI